MKRIYFFLFLFSFGLVVSCNSTKTVELTETEIIPEDISETIYMKAIGTEPFWSILVSETQLKYTNLDGNNILFKNTNTKKKDKGRTITAHNKEHFIELNIFETACSDGMSDTIFFLETHLILKENNQIIADEKGCAEYVMDKNLEGHWKLFRVNTTNVSENDYPTLPFLEFDIKEKKLTGNNSCNGIGADIITEGPNISFTYLHTTSSHCNYKNMEKEFMEVLRSISNYEVSDDLLRLKSDKYLLVFRRIE